MTNLFQLGNFKLASGRRSNFFIDRRALTGADWEALAYVGWEIVCRWGTPRISNIIPVMEGGMQLAAALHKIITLTNAGHTLIAEDVVTTGGSIGKLLDEHENSFGIAAFARGPLPIKYQNRLWAVCNIPVSGII